MTLNLASTDYALRAFVVPFLRALREQAPNIRVAVQPVDDQQLASQMDQGDIDLALITPDTTPQSYTLPRCSMSNTSAS